MDGKGGVDLPDKMTGKDLIAQENHEAGMEKQIFDSMDKVDRRDKRGHIAVYPSKAYRDNYDNIDWES